MKPLYEISNEYLNLYNNMDESTEEFDIVQKIQEINENFDIKAMNIVSLVKNFKLDLDNIDNVIDSLKYKRESLGKKIDNLYEYLKFNMEKIEKLEIKNSIHTAKIANNPPSVSVVDASIIPLEYINRTEIVKPDLTKIKNDLKMGVIIDGVLLEQKTRLVIK